MEDEALFDTLKIVFLILMLCNKSYEHIKNYGLYLPILNLEARPKAHDEISF